MRMLQHFGRSEPVRIDSRNHGRFVRFEQQFIVPEETRRGKGGHAMIWVGDKVTTLPAREIDSKRAKKIRKALRLD
jgi:hypothetical protein